MDLLYMDDFSDQPDKNSLDLFRASSDGNLTLLTQLCSSNPTSVNVLINGLAPLHVAAQKGHFDVIQFFSTLRDINLSICTQHEGRNVFHLMSASGDVNCFKKSALINNLTHTVNLFDFDVNGHNCLHIASFLGKLDMVVFLIQTLDFKPFEQARNSTMTALDFASSSNHASIVSFLLTLLEPSVDTTTRLVQAMGRACASAAYSVVNCLCHANCRIECIKNTTTGLFPLHVACMHGHEGIVSLLLCMPLVDPDCLDVVNNNDDNNHNNNVDNHIPPPIHFAALGGYSEIINMLIESGANPRLTHSNTNQVALHQSAISGSLSACKALTAIAQDCVDMVDANGKTPIDLALDSHHTALASYLTKVSLIRAMTNRHIDMLNQVNVKRYSR